MSASHSEPARRDHESWRAALAIVAAATLVRLIFAALLPLFPDETYYWDWSRRLSGGYFDHPPMIAVLIRAGTELASWFGLDASPFVVRLLPVLAGGAAALGVVAIARRIADGAAARWAAIAFALMPLAATGLVLATPDAPLLAFSAAGLYCVVRALQSPVRSRASLVWWSVAGVALGLAFASKYTAILLPITVTAAILIRPSLRARLAEPGPYLACAIATIVFLPVLHWNATHDWISFRFQIQHGLGAARGSAIKRELDLVGGQLGLVSPILFAAMAAAVWRTIRRPADDVRFALAVVAVGSWAFFVYSALRRPVEANWPAPSYIPGVALLAACAVSDGFRRWLRRGAVLAAVLVGVLYLHSLVPILPLPARRDPIARSAGWELVAQRADAARRAISARSWLGADRYQDVSELAFHAAGRPIVFCACLLGRHNHYELWPTFAERAAVGDALILALDEKPDVHPTAALLAPHFTSVRRGELAPLLRGGDTVSVRRIWTLEGYRGGWPPRAEP